MKEGNDDKDEASDDSSCLGWKVFVVGESHGARRAGKRVCRMAKEEYESNQNSQRKCKAWSKSKNSSQVASIVKHIFLLAGSGKHLSNSLWCCSYTPYCRVPRLDTMYKAYLA